MQISAHIFIWKICVCVKMSFFFLIRVEDVTRCNFFKKSAQSDHGVKKIAWGPMFFSPPLPHTTRIQASRFAPAKWYHGTTNMVLYFTCSGTDLLVLNQYHNLMVLILWYSISTSLEHHKYHYILEQTYQNFTYPKKSAPQYSGVRHFRISHTQKNRTALPRC